ncbi:MAG: hypothetical protein ABDH61_02300, partial [Acidilobaceae archaeon]
MRALALLVLILLGINASAAAPLPISRPAADSGFTGRFVAVGPSSDAAKAAVESLGGRVIEEFELLGGVTFEGPQ